MAYTTIGGYRLVLERPCWVCNLCNRPTYTNEIKHKCRSAPHFLGSNQIICFENLTKEEVKKIKKFLKELQNNGKNKSS